MSALKRTKTNKGLKRRKTFKPKTVSVSRVISEAKEETKYFDDYEWNAETIDLYTAPSEITNMLHIPQGSTVGNRIGNRIFLKRILIKLMFEGSVSQNYASVKLAVVKDTQPAAQHISALTPAQLWGLIWQDTGNATQNMVALPYIGNNKRFKIVKNMGIPMIPTGAYWDATAANPRWVPHTQFVDVNIPVNEVISYQDNTTKMPIQGCTYYVFAWSDTNANTTKVWSSTRAYFNDA